MSQAATQEQLEQMLALVETAMEGFHTSRYVAVAGFTVLIYDHILTFPTEIELIWRKPKGLVTYAFLFNRYLIPIVIAVGWFQMSGLGRNLPSSFCHAWLFIEAACMLVCFALAHYLASLRVRALHGARPWVDWTLWIAGLVYVAVTISITMLVLINVNIVSSRIVLNLRTLREGPGDPTSLTTDHGVELGAISMGQKTRRSGFPGAYLSTNRDPARTTWTRSTPSSPWPLGDLKGVDGSGQIQSRSVAVTIQVDVHRDVEVDELESADDSRWREDEKGSKV
ncbi:hypothetical protein FRB90_000301 [Tulasnella sp. 427]|nr:hypothetical protein FRB90_000301 [Tulasnella sp. 427]